MRQNTVISQIRSASREMVRQFGFLNDRFSSIGSTSQCHALVELDAHGVLTLGQLSAVLNLDKSTTSRLVMQLSEKGTCQMEPDAHDRRNKLISLTQKGQKLVNDIHHEANLQVKSALNRLSEEEQAVVLKGLSIYAKALKQSRLQDEYTFRKLQISDMPQLIHLIKTVWKEFGFDSSHPNASLFEDELHRTYETYMAKKSNYYVLLSGDKVIGGVGYAPLTGAPETICELKGLYLTAQLRGLGLGYLLFKNALQLAGKEGFKKCYFESMHYMNGSKLLSEKFNFTKLDKPMGNTGHTWTDCWYIKTLNEVDNE